MSKRSVLPQSRRHVFIFDEDWDWLEAQYGRYSTSQIGTGTVIKELVHLRVKQLRARAQELQDQRRQEATGAATGAPLGATSGAAK